MMKCNYLRCSTDMHWEVPVLMNNDKVFFELLKICKELNLYVPINVVYGAPYCKWSGGRHSAFNEELSEEQIRAILSEYNAYGIRCFFTFSRYSINAEDLENSYCNMLLRAAYEFGSGIIVSSDLLREHIKSRFQDMTVVASVIKATNETENGGQTEYYKDLLNRYDMVVPMPEYILDRKRILELKDYADRVIVLANQTCLANCKYAKMHYNYYSGDETSDFKQPPCYIEKQKIESVFNRVNLSFPYIEELAENGFLNFKLQGRNISPSKLLDYIGMYIFESTGIYGSIKQIVLSRIS